MSQRYDFDRFSLDARERRLTRDGEVVQIEPKSFDVLRLLLENAGRLVDKRAIVDAVWAGVAVTDNSLTRCIHQIRNALDDRANAPKFIETVAGSGYRFIASVDRIDDPASFPGEQAEGWPSKPRFWQGALVAFIVIVATIWIAVQAPERDLPPIRRLAVLPFENLTGDPDQEYFVQGVHEALIAELSRVAMIDVISRTSVMQFHASDLPVPEIATRLGVDAVVEGSVLRTGDNLTVTVQLIATEPERHLWANRYHQRVSELFEITTEITTAIAAEISIELSSEEKRLLGAPTPAVADAYDDYLLAQFHFARRTPESYRKAQLLYQQAIDKDPDLAPAYAGLGHSFGSAAIFGLIQPAIGMPKAKELAEKALRLDGNQIEAHLILAGVEFYYEWDAEAAERRVAHALRINPSSAHAYRILSEIHSAMGRHADALAAVERARELDPLVPTSQFKPALILYLARDYSAAAARAESALEYYPEFWPGHWLHCLALSAQKRHNEAIRACEAAVKHSHREPMATGTLGYVYALAGRNSEAMAIAGELEAVMSERYVGSASIAVIYSVLGQRERALEWLERAYRFRDQLLVHDNNATFLDQFRTEPRFIELSRDPPPVTDSASGRTDSFQ